MMQFLCLLSVNAALMNFDNSPLYFVQNVIGLFVFSTCFRELYVSCSKTKLVRGRFYNESSRTLSVSYVVKC